MTCPVPRRTRAIRSIARFLADEGGASAVEYGVLVALISIAIMGTVFALGDSINTLLYQKIANALANM
jgi:pilus assembly protein Flp/PilA